MVFAEGRECGGGVLAVFLRADRGAERVVEVRGALRGGDRVAASDVRLVDELLVAALDKREAVPSERFRGVAVIRTGQLAVGVVFVVVRAAVVRDGHHLVEIAVAVGLAALADHAARRVVGVARRHAVGGKYRTPSHKGFLSRAFKNSFTVGSIAR